MKPYLPILLAMVGLIALSCNLSNMLFINQAYPTITLAPTKPPPPTPKPTFTPTATPPPALRIAQADQNIFQGDFSKAIDENQIGLNQASDDRTRAAALFGIGKAQYLSGNCDSAVQTLTDLAKNYPESSQVPNAQYFLGQCYRQQNDFARAAEAFQKYLDLRPGVLDAYIQELRGDILVQDNQLDEAIKAYTAAKQAPQLGNTRLLEIKIGRAYASLGDQTNAIRNFMNVFEQTPNDYTKAQMDFLLGQSYLAMQMPEQAYARFQDAVNNYPKAYDSYSSLVALVDANQPVDELSRGIVDYYAGQYPVAAEILGRYMDSKPDHDGTPHYYRALSLQALGQNDQAVTEWDALIRDHKGDRFWNNAWDEKAYVLWSSMKKYADAANTLLDFIKLIPDADQAPAYLFEAGRIFERGDLLDQAAKTWERMINEYPTAPDSPRALFLAGITYYRMNKLDQALITFQRCLVLTSLPDEQSEALFWIAKTQQLQKNPAAAADSWKQAADRDPGGYYGERARDILLNTEPFTAPPDYTLQFNAKNEVHNAELWLRRTFNIPAETNLSDLGPLSSDERMRRGDALWELGQYADAISEFDSLRQDISQDPIKTFLLMNHLVDMGFYQQAILTSRQILTLAKLDDNDSLTAPDYFNHIRFGPFFKDIVIDAAQKEKFHPLFLFSVIRQESMFNSSIISSASAVGLMQILPDTGKEINQQLNWPPNYSDSDLKQPLVNIRFGVHYLARWRDYFGAEIYALAAYNGGPGNTIAWKALAKDDPDLFLEVIRSSETRTYVMQISEFMYIYRKYYTREK